MAIDSQATFSSTFGALPNVSDASWSTNISDWYDSRITSKAIGTGMTHILPPFTFTKATFQSQLSALSPVSSQADAAASIAACWEAAILASTYITAPGDSILPGGAAFTFSAVTTSLIDVPSIAVAKAGLITDLTNAALVEDPATSAFPIALRDALLALTVTITGLNSLPIPLPLVVTSIPLL